MTAQLVTLANGMTLNIDGTVTATKKARTNKPQNGYIVYQGPSMLDGSPIVAIATMNTANEKTGNMIQTWILRADMSPTEASKAKKDDAVCGRCPHRVSMNGACYVALHQAPLSVYKAFVKGNYKELDSSDLMHFEGRYIRLGAYGDPAAVPFAVWDKLVSVAKGHTGYTHQIGHKNFDARIGTLCQISADTENQARKAQEQGFKTFRVKTDKMRKVEGEIECLSVSHGISCLDCGLCNGKQANIVIDVHGKNAARFSKLERII